MPGHKLAVEEGGKTLVTGKQEQQDQVRLLINTAARNNGYLLTNQVHDAFAAEEHTNERLTAPSRLQSEGIGFPKDAADDKLRTPA